MLISQPVSQLGTKRNTDNINKNIKNGKFKKSRD